MCLPQVESAKLVGAGVVCDCIVSVCMFLLVPFPHSMWFEVQALSTLVTCMCGLIESALAVATVCD